jgi:hypothetical protein
MNDWLGTGTKAQLWREYLELNVLDSQAARGEQADPATLQQILQNFSANEESLKHPVFEEVRIALRAQIDQLYKLQTAELSDLQFAAKQAIASFVPPSKAQLEYDREIALYELKLLKKVYRRDLDSRTRAGIFHKLKLNDAITLLEEVEIEMPPEVSVGKVESMIDAQRALLQAIEDKIDALPVTPPMEDSDESEDEVADDTLQAPGPDESDDLETLESKADALKERITELRKKRADILKTDRPRLVERTKTGRELRRFQKRFRDLSRKRLDPAFASARGAMDRFTDAYIFGTQDNIQEDYLEKVDELSTLIPTLANPSEQLSHAKLGQLLLWMERHKQLNDLCVAIRKRYSNANGYVAVSSRLIQALTSRTDAAYDRVAEDFLGRFARGLSCTDTSISVVPAHDPNQVRVSILLSGTATANTYVRERSFRIDSSSSGYLSARRDLFANLNGLFASDSSVDAAMSAQYGGISTSIGFIQRLAAKSFYEQLPRTDAESTRRVKDRLMNQFDSETSKVIQEGIGQVEAVSEKARAMSAYLPQIYLRSFHDRIEAVAKKDTQFSLAATTQPVLQTAGSDVQLRLHESMLSNYLDLLFAGKSFTRDELIAEAEELLGRKDLVPKDELADEVEDFKITFPRTRPVQVEFANSRLGVTITGSRFEQGDRSITTTVVAKLSFKVVNRNGKLFLVLAGSPQIELSKDEDPSAESIAFAKVLEKRITESAAESGEAAFELPPNLIPEVEALDGIDVVDSLQLGLLKLEQGWLYLGWNYQFGVVDTPAIWNEMTIQGYDSMRLEGSSVLESEVIIAE